ncbi:MAG: hypothetical protein KC503_36835 [Myxococcales bacterium]|nr:hypothetical protein [Myxococcales bacterium]
MARTDLEYEYELAGQRRPGAEQPDAVQALVDREARRLDLLNRNLDARIAELPPKWRPVAEGPRADLEPDDVAELVAEVERLAAADAPAVHAEREAFCAFMAPLGRVGARGPTMYSNGVVTYPSGRTRGQLRTPHEQRVRALRAKVARRMGVDPDGPRMPERRVVGTTGTIVKVPEGETRGSWLRRAWRALRGKA